HNISVTGPSPGKDYGTVRGRDNPASIGSRDVYSCMIVNVRTVERILPRTRSACYVSAHRQERRSRGQQKRPLRVEVLQITVSLFQLATRFIVLLDGFQGPRRRRPRLDEVFSGKSAHTPQFPIRSCQDRELPGGRFEEVYFFTKLGSLNPIVLVFRTERIILREQAVIVRQQSQHPDIVVRGLASSYKNGQRRGA